MNGKFVCEIQNTYLRRAFLVLYIPIGLLYNILYHYPKQSVMQAYWYSCLVWQHREPVNVFIHEGQGPDYNPAYDEEFGLD